MARRIADDDLITLAQFEQLPEEDEWRIELVRGRLVRSPRPASLHARISTLFVSRLHAYAESTGLGVVLTDPGVVVARNPDTVRGPDVAYFSNERIPESSYATTFWGAPDLAVEILSPSNRAGYVRDKVADYLAAGVRMVWVADPRRRTVVVHRQGGASRTLNDGDVLAGEDVLPGFQLILAAFFAV